MGKNQYKEIEKWIVLYVNQFRKSKGVSPLRKNAGLARVARGHSAKMALKRRIWHGNGAHVAGQSITHQGFWDFIGSIFNRGYSGENVGLMYTGRVRGIKKTIRTKKDIAYAQFNSWKKSPGHRSNMLNSNFRLIGVGVKRNGKGYYSTQIFYG